MTLTHPDVVAAIDFGTHGTGYAWAKVRTNRDGTVNLDETRKGLVYNEEWPGMGTRYHKDLSAVLLSPGGDITEWGYEARREWARLAAGGGDGSGYGYASSFKMALKADAYRSVRAPGAGSVVIDSGEKAYPLVVGYLRRMYQMALTEIREKAEGCQENQIRWCLTVPAIWDEAEKQLMRRAAGEAGMPTGRDRLLLALEPEAAAVYCQVRLAQELGTWREKKSQVMTAGTRFMVIDCGGGTVDISAFRVQAVKGGRERLAGIGRATGGKLGSEYINEVFIERVLQDRLGGPEVMARIRRECPHALLELVDSWESEKITAKAGRVDKGSGPSIERAVHLTSIPGEIRDLLSPETVERLAELGSPHRISVTPQECKRLFDSVINNLIELVEEELALMIASDGAQAAPERLLLVGGMSRSNYLQERLRWHFGKRVTLLLAPDPAAAVLFGAVLFGSYPWIIGSRPPRYTYGCRSAELFDPDLDRGKTVSTAANGKEYCEDRFRVLAKKGQAINVDHKQSIDYYPLRESQDTITVDLYRSTRPDPRHVDEPDCKKIGQFKIKLGESMKRPFKERVATVEMKFGDTDISFSGINKQTGKLVSVTLEWDGNG